jgi:HSP20 family protein
VGVFQRSLRLPTAVDASQVQARFDNGVLTISIPKTGAKEGSRRVLIRSGADSGTKAQKGAEAADDTNANDKGGDTPH